MIRMKIWPYLIAAVILTNMRYRNETTYETYS